MKKTRIFSMVFAIGLLGLIASGCTPSSGGTPEVQKETHTAKSSDLIKFKLNVTDAKYLATQWADQQDERSARAAYARKASREGDEADTEEEASPLDSLVAVVEDENGELTEETVLEVPAEELKLAEWCVPQPVREIYQCPYETAEEPNKGIYTVFACYINWWKYTDETPAPGISMLMYAKPDGTTVDVLNKAGKVNYFLTTWQKENEGEDYIQFDETGNLFALAHDDDPDGKYIIFRYNPSTNKLDEYSLTNIEGDVYIRNFKVTKDGKWIFLNVMVDNKQNNVYAFQVNANKPPLSMYEYKTTNASAEPSWAVSSIAINPVTNLAYWYVDDYNDMGRPNSGLYVAEKDTNGYSEAKVKKYHAVQWWQILDFIKTSIFGISPSDMEAYRANLTYQEVVAADKNLDYKKLLDYLKGLCCYDGEIEFNFSKFKDMTGVTCKGGDGNEYTTDDFAILGKCDLKDEAALKYLFTTSLEDVLNLDDSAKNDWTDNNLFSTLVERFNYDYWNNGGLAESEGYSILSERTEPAFPLGYFMFQKDKDGKATDKSAYFLDDDAGFFKSAFGAHMNGIILANNEGTWVLSDIWSETKVNKDGTKGNNSHATAFQLTDNRGNFKCTQPGDLATLKFWPRWDYDTANRDETDPWYQNPFVANSDGIAALAVDKKTVYYHSNNVTKDLLASDPNKASFSGIYAFKLQDKELIYNAKTNGGYITVSIDLATGTAKKLPLEKKVESMLGL